MLDPTRPAAGQQLLAALRASSVVVPGIRLVPERLTVSALGAGESYAAWLVTDEVQSLVFRLPRRPREDMPTPMTDEFRAASYIPPDVGSRPIAMDDSSDNGLGCPYIVSTFVPGSVFDASDWDERLLREHARRLAKLHDRTFALAGPLGGEMSTLDIVREFDDSLAWWRNAHPDVVDDDEVAALARDIRDRLRTAAQDFEGIPYSFIHGDLVATNVVVDPAGTPRYIDWEWARIGDVAQDLAYIGGEVTGGPWYVPMDAATVTRYLAEYVEARAAQPDGPTGSPSALRRRRDAWELVERFLSSLHFSHQVRVGADPGRYAGAVRELRSTLRARLDA